MLKPSETGRACPPRPHIRAALIIALAIGTGAAGSASATIYSGAGGGASDIQSVVDNFRAALGDNNGNTPGFQDGGRREINWDGGGDAADAAIFGNPMTTFAFRGNVNTTPGTGLEISGQPQPRFGEINPTYPDIFQTFSAPRLFAPLGSNVTDVFFTKPGDETVSGLTNGFGVVFTDVDLGFTTSIELFDDSSTSVGIYYAEAYDEGLSFLGIEFEEALIARARIVTGNTALGPNDGDGIDVVAMDDFIYGEPILAEVPAPGALALLGLGVSGIAAGRKRRRRAG